MNFNELRKGDMINFDMISPGIMSSQYKAVHVEGALVSYNVAALVDNEVVVKHRNFFPFFKESVNGIDDPSVYEYLLLKKDLNTNDVFAVGVPWINQASLETTKGRVGTILIGNWQERFNAPLKDFLQNLGASYTIQITDKNI
jgi:hypothetical protein